MIPRRSGKNPGPLSGAALLFALAAGLAVATPRGSGASEPAEPATEKPSRFSIGGYGSINYFAYDWATDPNRRNQIDLERLTLEGVCQLNEKAHLKAELEIEHGGTGVTVEFDRFEEFGEFEYEVEKGGEVLLEQIYLEWKWSAALLGRVGRVRVPVGLASVYDEPTDYFTTTRSEMESSIIPVGWYENGLQARGQIGGGGRLAYVLSLVNGLDSSGFSSSSWIVRGHQKRFETVNAEDIAIAARLDYTLPDETTFGLSIYTGDTADNRPKPDLEVDARVLVGDVHAVLARGPLSLRALALAGSLENADLVSRANRNLSNNLNVKRTPVGSEAFGWSIEGAYDIAPLIHVAAARLDLFARYEQYDTMAEVEGEVFDNPRWERETTTLGTNLQPIPGAVLKAQYSHRKLGTSSANTEDTVSAGVGFEF